MIRKNVVLSVCVSSLFLICLALLAIANCPGQSLQETFKNPVEFVVSGDNVFELRLGPTEHEIDGKRYCLRAYGMIPAPTIRVPAVQNLRIRVNLHNDFTKSDYREIQGDGSTIGCFDFNLTNLHAHGSHVRPDYAIQDPGDLCQGDGCGPDGKYFADNVLHLVSAGEMAQYRWDLDEDHLHYPGMNWYHPHIHGSTAIQVTSGAAGVWIVEGNLDEIQSVADAKERIIVLNQIPFMDEGVVPLERGQACTEDTLSYNNFILIEDEETTTISPTLVNGQLRSRIVTPPGQVERWRGAWRCAGSDGTYACKGIG